MKGKISLLRWKIIISDMAFTQKRYWRIPFTAHEPTEITSSRSAPVIQESPWVGQKK